MAVNLQLFRLAEHAVGKDLRTLLVQWRNDGLTYQEIAERLGADHGVVVTRQTVSKWARMGAAA